MTFADLQSICCLMLNVLDVCVMLMWLEKVPSWHVLHLLSPQRWNPTSLFLLLSFCFLWVSDTCISFPLGVLNTLPHSSHVLLLLSMSMSGVSTMLLLGGSLRLTNMSFRLRLRLYASSGGLGKTLLQRSFDRSTGCKSLSFFFKSGTMGLYVVENITLSSRFEPSTTFGCKSSSRVCVLLPYEYPL